jgi:hypothetical protein
MPLVDHPVLSASRIEDVEYVTAGTDRLSFEREAVADP